MPEEKKRYHTRRRDKEITSPDRLKEIIKTQKYLTISMCKDNDPYLVTLNYGYSESENCFYFHCARNGKKIDYLESNPIVWGQILEDSGYIDGECDHNYATIQFRGEVEFVEGTASILHGLDLMIDQLEANPGPVKERIRKSPDLNIVKVGRINILDMTGKEYKGG